MAFCRRATYQAVRRAEAGLSLAEICCRFAATHWFRLIQILQLQKMDLPKLIREPGHKHCRQNRNQKKADAFRREPRFACDERFEKRLDR